MDVYQIQKELDLLKHKIEEKQANAPKDKLSMIVFSGDMDKLLAAFIIATGAAAMDMEVYMT